jgi:hypothetical protein
MMRRAISIVPFEPLHLALIRDRAEQRGEAERFGEVRGASAEGGPAFSAIEADEVGNITAVLACAGLVEVHPPTAPNGGYAFAWGYFAEGLRAKQWATVTAAIRGVLDGCGYARVDMGVNPAFAAAGRYAVALGFSAMATIYSRSSGRPHPIQPRAGTEVTE